MIWIRYGIIPAINSVRVNLPEKHLWSLASERIKEPESEGKLINPGTKLYMDGDDRS